MLIKARFPASEVRDIGWTNLVKQWAAQRARLVAARQRVTDRIVRNRVVTERYGRPVLSIPNNLVPA
jgi:hypothetical protein